MSLWFNKDKPDAEGSEKKKETETLIFSETTAARQKVPDKRTKLTDIFSRQTNSAKSIFLTALLYFCLNANHFFIM